MKINKLNEICIDNLTEKNRKLTIKYVFIIVILGVMITDSLIIKYLNLSVTKLVYSNILTVMFTLIIFKIITKLRLCNEYKREIENLKLYVKTIDEFNIELRRFKHNYLNILATLYSYIQETHNDELKNYFCQIVDECKNIKGTNISGLSVIKYMPLKSLLTVKINSAINENILPTLYCSSNFELKGMNLCDLCEVIGVLIDNALEESKNLDVKDRKLGIEFVNVNDCLIVNIRNKYKEKPNIFSILYECKTTKGKNRGFGLKSVRNILDKYDDKVNLNTYLDEKENTFVQELVIEQK